MATDRIVAGVAGATTAPTSETAIATLAAGGAPGGGDAILVRADCPLIGAASVTAMRLRIRRGPVSGLTGAVVGDSGSVTVTGAQTFAGQAAFYDAAYDGTGYVLSVQATGAAGTCGPGILEAQPITAADTFAAG